MNLFDERPPPGSASPTAMALVTPSSIDLEPAGSTASRDLMARMVRTIYPHDRFGDEPYRRVADAIFAASCATPALKIAFAAALHDLASSGFAALEGQPAIDHLRAIEDTAFFRLVRSTAVVALYDDPAVWETLGYEGPSVDKGGYVDRGFNDLDWLPEPRIEEYGVSS